MRYTVLGSAESAFLGSKLFFTLFWAVCRVQSGQFWAVNYRWKIYCPSFDSLAASPVKVFLSFLKKGGNYEETKSLEAL